MYDVQDVVKWTGKWARGPLTSCILRASRAHWAHGHVSECQMFAAFALAFRRSWGIGFIGIGVFLTPCCKSCLFLPCFRQRGSCYSKVQKCQNMVAKCTNPVSQEPSGTVRNRSWPFLVHGVSNYIPTMLQNCVSWCFGHCCSVPGTVWNGSERFLSHMVYINLLVLRLYIVFS